MAKEKKMVLNDIMLKGKNNKYFKTRFQKVKMN
jgi:hypothetical protein